MFQRCRGGGRNAHERRDKTRERERERVFPVAEAWENGWKYWFVIITPIVQNKNHQNLFKKNVIPPSQVLAWRGWRWPER